ncbi:alpha/beta fold hydrolase [Streptomyces zaomyceticus]|uniref:alpha/beta fold hydrolase n=1 Tax=Streptomyces zaomyceticus TaxID=68286 RepID=UPI0032483495
MALDQRGHGLSDRSPVFSRTGYVEDAAAVLEHLGVHGAAVLGHSLGGVNVYRLAAWLPGIVDALIVEDVGAEVDDDSSFSRRSTVLSAEHATDMAARRPHTRRIELRAGHTVHETVPEEFAAAVNGFLGSL